MNLHRSKSTTGSVLILALFIVGIAILVVASYMGTALQRNKIAMRSAAWNQALAVAEAGIEEGLAQIQYSFPPTNGWTSAGGRYTKTRTSPFGGSDCYFSVNLNSTEPPVVTATGYVRAPLMSTYIKRTVQVVAAKGTNQYPYGLHAKGAITLGGGSTVDSFDSQDPNYSTNGMYDPNRHKANCYVVSEAGAARTIQVGTVTIFGYVETSAGAGTVTVNSSGVVGDNNYASNSINAGTVQMSPVVHALTNNNRDIADVILPANLTSALPPVLGVSPPYSVNGTNYDYCLGDTTNYFPGSFSISGSMIVTGHATFYVSGSFKMNSGGFLYLTPGSTLTLYVGTTNAAGNDSISFSGGGVANGGGVAANLAIFGLPSVKTASYKGNSTFVGTCDAPEASVSMGGSSDACGSIVGNDITLSGGTSFHYDESRGGNPYPKYTVVSWREL